MTREDSPVWMIVCVDGGATVAQQVCAKTVERKLGLPTEASRGLSKFGWLKALNSSARSCSRTASVTRQSFTGAFYFQTQALKWTGGSGGTWTMLIVDK